jgi:hypothetical protein
MMLGMGIGMGFGTNVAALGGGGGFTPASIAGLDFWIEARDLTHLFTDTGGTTPVTADGNTVALAKDKSSAARDVSAPVVGERPTYKTDLTKPSLLFDGVGNLMQSASSLSWGDGSGQMWFALSIQSVGTSTLEIMTIKQGTYVADVNVSTVAQIEVNTAGGFGTDNGSAVSGGTPYVLIGQMTAGSPPTAEMWVNNVSGGSSNLPGALLTNTSQLLISGGGSPWNGRVFGLCHGTGVLSSSDRPSLQTYMAALHP